MECFHSRSCFENIELEGCPPMWLIYLQSWLICLKPSLMLERILICAVSTLRDKNYFSLLKLQNISFFIIVVFLGVLLLLFLLPSSQNLLSRYYTLCRCSSPSCQWAYLAQLCTIGSIGKVYRVSGSGLGDRYCKLGSLFATVNAFGGRSTKYHLYNK